MTTPTVRQIDVDVPGALLVPLLVSHSRADTVVLPAMAEHVAPGGTRALQPRWPRWPRWPR
jgi:hypothetical protein